MMDYASFFSNNVHTYLLSKKRYNTEKHSSIVRGATSSSFRGGRLSTVVQLFRKWSHIIILYLCPQTRSPLHKHTHSAQSWLVKSEKTERFATALEAESPVSSEISDLRNFWFHAMCACTEQQATYQIHWENWWLGFRVWCLAKYVALGFMLQLEKEKQLKSRNKSNIFHWFYLFPYCSLLSVSDILPKSFNLHNTYQKSNRQTLFLYSENQNNWQKIIGQKFRRGQKFHLTLGYRNLLNRTFCNSVGDRASGLQAHS